MTGGLDIDATLRWRYGVFPRIGLWAWTLLCLPLGLAALTLVGVANRYDAFSYGRHAAFVRWLVPWRLSAAAALLPLVALSPFLLSRSASHMTWATQLLVVAAGLVLAEVYSVCLHRESYIAAFEPWFIATDRAVLGKPALRASDRRLHYLVRTQTLYVLPLFFASVLVDGGDPPAAWVLFFAFLIKFVVPAWVDYEAYFHWDMHCAILGMRDGGYLTRLWRGVCECLLGPAVGSLPYIYSTEHLLIHHPQNAGPGDVHSPLPYRRTSVIEFTHYLCKTVIVLATVVGVATNRRVRGRPRRRLLLGVGLVWLVAVAALVLNRPLGTWIVGAVVFRGANTAIAQYVWHGLHDGSGRAHPMSSTINWVAPPVTAGVVAHGDEGIQAEKSRPEVHAAPGDLVHPTSSLREYVPNPGSDWAFYDNYHLIHHLHPRAHFEDYPRLLESEATRIADFGSPVITLDRYESFFSNLMKRDLAAVAPGYQTGDDLETRCRVLADRLEPWDASRSAISAVSESAIGSRFDSALSRAWRTWSK